LNVPHSYTAGINTTTTYDGDTQYYGNYYNWYAATAGSGTYEMTFSDNDVTSSICPSGWELPRYTDEKSYNNLITAYNITTTEDTGVQAIRSRPLSFVFSGHYASGSGAIYDKDSLGRWWESKSGTVYNAYGFQVYDSTSTKTKIQSAKNFGRPVRCVAK